MAKSKSIEEHEEQLDLAKKPDSTTKQAQKKPKVKATKEEAKGRLDSAKKQLPKEKKVEVSKVKVTEIALQLGIKPKDVLAKAKEIDIEIKSVSSSVVENEAQAIYDYISQGIKPTIIPTIVLAKEKPKKAESSTKEKSTKKPKKEEAKKPTPKKAKQAPKKEEAKEIKTEVESTKKETMKETARETAREIRKIIIVSKNNVKENNIEQKKKLDIEKAKEAKDNILHPIDIPKADTKVKKKPKEHKNIQSHKANEQKIDINRNLGDTKIDDDDEEIMMFDINQIDHRGDEEKEDKITDRIRIQRANPWFSDNIGRSRQKNKHRSHRRDSTNSHHTSSNNQARGIISIPDEIRIYEFADRVNLKVTDIISRLFKMGEMATKNDFLDATTIEILANEFDLKIELSKATQELEYLQGSDDSTKSNIELVQRAPVVTIMGHVDHGKTSLLDYIRNSRVTKTEQGGITQHIGAYMVNKNGRDITFIDTPGHEAFASMRSRGAQVTDIAVIVIAADDGVKQQTKEALAHAMDSDVEIIIAMNKMDKEDANPDKLKAEMAELGYNPISWGGEYDFVPVSAKTGEGIDELLDTILLQAEIMELKANIASKPKAVVLEGSLDKGKGPVVTVIVQEGVLRVGDSVVADTAYGKVRALIRDDGQNTSELKPSEIALLVGLNEVPSAGSILVGVESDAIAKEYANKRKSYLRTKELSKSTKVSFDELSSVIADGRLKPLRIILKADTQGSLEAIKVSLEALSNDEVRINIINSSVGNITESDIDIAASSSDCYIFGFNVKPLSILKSKAKEQQVRINSYSVIYDLIDDVKLIISEMMSPIIEEEIVGTLEVRDIFSIGKGNIIVGCFVLDGVATRGARVNVLRNDRLIHSSTISSLKRFKDDVKEVTKGYECGVMIDAFNDIKVGDTLQVIQEVAKAKQI